MERLFRGVKYDSHPIELEVIEGDTKGRYRGLMWRGHHYRQPPHLRPMSQEMTYRGVHYKKG